MAPAHPMRGGHGAFARVDIPFVLVMPAADLRWSEPAGSDYACTFVGP